MKSSGIFALTCFPECRRESALSANVSPDRNMNARYKRNFERGKFNIIGMCNIGCPAMLLFDGAFFLFSLSTEPCVQRPNPFRGQKSVVLQGFWIYVCIYKIRKLRFDCLHQFGCCQEYKWRLLLHELYYVAAVMEMDWQWQLEH